MEEARQREAREAREGMAALDTFLFVFAALATVWLAYLVLLESFQAGWQILLLVVFWLLVAYLVLPRLHRVLTRLYLPDYFIGRARTSDGLLGDPVNLALLGDEAQVHAAMTVAGWTRADEVTLASSLTIIRSTLTRESYDRAPVSPLHLWGRKQDFAYQQEVEGNPSKRHHVRFWRCPEGWRLPGGDAVDWLAAGTYDRSVGLSLMTLQVTHRIAENIDAERDHIVTTVMTSNPAADVERIRDFSSGYHARNGGGDTIRTDGDLPVLDVRAVDAPETSHVPTVTDSRDRRPAQTVFGAGVALLRGALSATIALVLFADPSSVDIVSTETSSAVGTLTGVSFAVVAAVDLWLGIATYRGRNWARVLLMLVSVFTIVSAWIADVRGGPRPTLSTDLPVVALGILVLLALSSQAAREYAVRDRTVVLPG